MVQPDCTAELKAAFDAVDVTGYVHARDIDRGVEVGLNAEEPVVAASTFKVAVLVEFFRQLDAGRIDPLARVTVEGAGRAPGPTGLSVFRDPVELSWRDLALSMMTVSDNAATDVICELIGIDNVNATMDAFDLPGTKLASDCRGIFQAMAEDAEVASLADFPASPGPELLAKLRALTPTATNRTTPREMSRLLELIWTDGAASPESCDAMRAILAAQVWPHRLTAGFPEGEIRIAGKTGTLINVRNEAGVVEYPDGGRYAVSVYTQGPSPASKNPPVDAVIGRAARIAVDCLRLS